MTTSAFIRQRNNVMPNDAVLLVAVDPHYLTFSAPGNPLFVTRAPKLERGKKFGQSRGRYILSTLLIRALCQRYDGVTRRCIPRADEALCVCDTRRKTHPDETLPSGETPAMGIA